ncbi:zinc finger protein [Saccharopolyspora phatthalungensis]|uniref:Zinc finger protein n=1 Tax=Saccharopolyspora phatthalungensis TaxID=664693 RepID=A0A840PXL0_9PSEU|nr:zinc finger protein [Saccharopolyspora phatthalungensis]MBB5152500.1 hypothetical protein [Saccharopolyspora phatthalungensis]
MSQWLLILAAVLLWAAMHGTGLLPWWLVSRPGATALALTRRGSFVPITARWYHRDGGVMYQPHPFHWVRADGKRHASTDPKPRMGYPTGCVVGTLCGHQLAAENTDPAWLWETCRTCDDKAHALAKASTPPAASAR